MKKTYYLFILLLWLSVPAISQVNVKDSIVRAPLISFNYAFQIPEGDMSNRFGYNHAVGATFLLKPQKHKWMFGADWNYIFGDQIKEKNILDNLRTSEGMLISADGTLTMPRVWERGWYSHLKFGRLLGGPAPNKNCGFFVMAGAGMLYHKLRIEDISTKVPQLNKEYRKGYDRLTYGFSTSQFLGYLFLDNRRLVNFYAGIEFIQGFTQNRRGFNFDTGMYDTAKRLDLLYGFKVGFCIPLYERVAKEYYTY